MGVCRWPLPRTTSAARRIEANTVYGVIGSAGVTGMRLAVPTGSLPATRLPSRFDIRTGCPRLNHAPSIVASAGPAWQSGGIPAQLGDGQATEVPAAEAGQGRSGP